jgi:hypothetical protein
MTEDEPHISTPEQAQAMGIVQDVLRRRRVGEAISNDEVLADHPALRSHLADLLEKAAAVAFLAEQACGEDWGNLERVMDGDSLSDPHGHFYEGTVQLPSFDTGESQPSRITVFEELGPVAAPPAQPATGTAIEGVHVVDSPPLTPHSPQVREQEFARKTLAIYGTAIALRPVRYRPAVRPPMALLRIRDDSQIDAEVFRLRQETTVIGRVRGEVVIPHDLQMSGAHASITREEHNGKFRWVLRDLDSRNGVFVRFKRAKLKDEDLLLVANRLVRFSAGTGSAPSSLQEIVDGNPAEKLILEPRTEYTIGRDPQSCSAFLGDEPQLNLRHASLESDAEGTWSMMCCKSVNGIWIRVIEVSLIHKAAFQLGEQRFIFDAY